MPVIRPFFVAGKLPVADTGPANVALLAAWGWLPPPFRQAYVAEAFARSVYATVCWPTPASSQETTREPPALMLSFVEKKCAPLVAAAAPANARTAAVAISNRLDLAGLLMLLLPVRDLEKADLTG